MSIRVCFDAVTTSVAKVMHLQDYGLEPGCEASFVLLQARDAVEAIQLRANRLKVWRKGKLLAETAEVVALLRVEGTRRLNEQVKRNRERFPEDFIFD